MPSLIILTKCSSYNFLEDLKKIPYPETFLLQNVDREPSGSRSRIYVAIIATQNG